MNWDCKLWWYSQEIKAELYSSVNRESGGCIEPCRFSSCTWSRTSIQCIWDRECEQWHQQMKMPDFCSFSGNQKLFCYLNIGAVPEQSGTEVPTGWKFLQSDFPSLFPSRCDCNFQSAWTGLWVHQHSVTAVPAGNEAPAGNLAKQRRYLLR